MLSSKNMRAAWSEKVEDLRHSLSFEGMGAYWIGAQVYLRKDRQRPCRC
jgi:hypothetical protein